MAKGVRARFAAEKQATRQGIMARVGSPGLERTSNAGFSRVEDESPKDRRTKLQSTSLPLNFPLLSPSILFPSIISSISQWLFLFFFFFF